MKNFIIFSLCLSLTIFAVARATTLSKAPVAAAKTTQKISDGEISAEESYVEEEPFNMSEVEEDEVAAEEEETNEEAAGHDEDNIEDASDVEGEDMNGDDSGGGDDGAADEGD